MRHALPLAALALLGPLAAAAPAEASSVASLLDRCRAELDEALRQGPAESKFWEKTV